jgi:hypothetical protein
VSGLTVTAGYGVVRFRTPTAVAAGARAVRSPSVSASEIRPRERRDAKVVMPPCGDID